MENREINELFGCSCYDLHHIARLHYWYPTKEEIENPDPEWEDEIYMTLLVRQWRSGIIPDFWSKYFWEDFDGFKKEYWQDFYRSSSWKRLFIGIKYFFRGKAPEDSYLGSLTFREDDTERLLQVLSVFDHKNIETTETKCVIDNERYLLEIGYDEELLKEFKKGLHETIYADVQLKQFGPLQGIKRAKYALKYIFNNIQEEMEFPIDAENAAIIKNIIKEIQEIKDEE